VEEQAPGVFPKTLRNMWAAVTILNPLTALLALLLIPIAETCGHQNALLAHMGGQAAGTWLATLISIDAALVLSGAVLTSYVGVNGLMRRMTLDRCLPQFLAKRNRRGTTHRIILTFFALCVSVLFITRGELEALAGVYTISFLAVMALFAVGNILLKVKRARLSRPTRASVPAVLIAVAAVTAGLVGNAMMNPPYVGVFLEYFVPSVLIVSVMFGRITLLKACLFTLRAISGALVRRTARLSGAIRDRIDQINAQQVVFFTRGDNVANLNNAILYIRKNEHTGRVKVVTVAQDPNEVPARLTQDLRFLDEAYPDLDIELVVVDGAFGPELIQELSRRWRIPTNLMFIGSPGEGFRYGLAELGGVRLII
jgi:amino acid transporter